VLPVSRSLAARPAPTTESLFERLTRFALQSEPSPCICVRAKHAHILNAVNFNTPLLAIPLEGHKRVRHAQRSIDVAVGEIFLVSRPTAVDVENFPDRNTGRYLAIGILLEEHVLGAARQLARTPVGSGSGSIAAIGIDPYLPDLESWLDATQADDCTLASHALVGIVLKMYVEGQRSLLYPAAPPLSARIRDLVARRPDHAWTSSQLEDTFGVSGATLRRHLAAEGVTLRELIVDARLSGALTLLLTSDLPVKTVASRVGYTSAASFAKRFRERYGVEPSRIGGIGGV
jgi:AraC-like DNA-binding protein